MKEPYKEGFSLRTFGELSFSDIGELFGKTESWARVTYHRARLIIKEEMQKWEKELRKAARTGNGNRRSIAQDRITQLTAEYKALAEV